MFLLLDSVVARRAPSNLTNIRFRDCRERPGRNSCRLTNSVCLHNNHSQAVTEKAQAKGIGYRSGVHSRRIRIPKDLQPRVSQFVRAGT
jgi:hypothetical protein